MPSTLGVVAAHRTAAAPLIPATGLALWLDAAAAATFTYSAGAVVSQWRDKSGAAHHFDHLTGTAPTRDTTINAVTAVRFNVARLQQVGFAQSFTAAELFAVVQNVTENGGGWLGGWSTAATEAQHYPFTDGTIYEPWGSSVRQTLGNPVPSLMVGHIYNVRSAAGSYVATINDGALYSTATNTVHFNGSGIWYYVGYGGTGGGDLKVGEVVVYNRVLSGAERTQVQTYLRTKWGTP